MFCFRDNAEIVDFGKGIHMTILGGCTKLNAMHWSTPANTVSPSHEHPEEQVGYVLKGKIEVTVGAETSVLGAGDCYFIPGNKPHHFRIIENSEVVDIFSPPRPQPRPEEIKKK